MAIDYDVYSPEIGLDAWLNKPSVFPDSGTGVLADPIEEAVNLSDTLSGSELGAIVAYGKKTFSDTSLGAIFGMDTDGTYKWLIGGTSSSIDWGVTTAGTLTINGLITVTAGSNIAGWITTVDTLYSLASGTPTASPNNGVIIDSSNPQLVIYEGTAKRIEIGYLSAAVFGLRGYATDGTTTVFELSDTQQMIAGWNFNANVLRTGTTGANSNVLIDSGNSLLRLGPTTGNYLTLDGANLRIRTSTFSAGLQGWSVESDGSAEFANITVRGEFHSQVLSYGEIHSAAGSQIVAVSAGKLKNDATSVTSPTTFNVDIDDPDTGHTQVFAASDILWVKDGSGNQNYWTVSSASDQTTFWRYVCTKSNGSNAIFRAGAAIVDLGPSGSGFLFMTADDSNGPFYSVRTHAGSPWSTTTERVRVGNLNGYLGYVADIYGLGVGSNSAGEANLTIEPTNGIRIRSGSTLLFQVDNAGAATIGGFLISATTITAATTNLILDSSGKAFSINSATYGASGIQLQYNGGTPRAYIGDGSNNFLQFDGTTFSASGALSNQVSVTTGEAILIGDHLGFTSADTIKRYAPTAIPNTFDQSSTLATTVVYNNTTRGGRLIQLTTSLYGFVYYDDNSGVDEPNIVRIPVTGNTGVVGTLEKNDFDLDSVTTTLDMAYMDATRVLVCASKSNSFKAQIIDLSTTITNGAAVTIDTSSVSEGFCDYVSDLHVLFVSHDTATGNLQFHKYTASSSTLTSSSSGNIYTGWSAKTWTLKGIRKWGTSNYFAFLIQNTTDGRAEVLIAHYDTGSSTWDSVGTPVSVGSSVTTTIGAIACFADCSETLMMMMCPTSTTAGSYFLCYRASSTSTVPQFGTINATPTSGASAGYTLTKANARCAIMNTQSGTTATMTLLEINSAGTDLVTRASNTMTDFNGSNLPSNGITCCFHANPTRLGWVGIVSASDIAAGTGLYTLPTPVGIAKATAAASASLLVVTGGPANSLVTLTATQKYYADIGGLLTTDGNGTPDKVGVTKDTDELIVKSW